jgi:hypothetical protein
VQGDRICTGYSSCSQESDISTPLLLSTIWYTNKAQFNELCLVFLCDVRAPEFVSDLTVDGK